MSRHRGHGSSLVLPIHLVEAVMGGLSLVVVDRLPLDVHGNGKISTAFWQPLLRRV